MARNTVANTKNGQGTSAPALPADFVGKLSSGIAESRAQTRVAGGKPFLRLLKDGAWVYGQEDIEVEEGSTWCVNIMSLAHGWSCWVERGGSQKNELVGEVMDSMANPRPPRPEPVEGTPFSEQRGFELKCMDGEDAGTEVIYKTASVGGMRAVDGLLAEIQKALVEHPHFAFPVLALEQDSYNHNKWGKTYVPVFTIAGWADMNGQLAPEGMKLAAPEPDPGLPTSVTQPTKRRNAAQASNPEPEPTPDPKSTTQAHTGQRRRPAR